MSAAGAIRTTQQSRVLIVEDEGLIAHDIANRLVHAGYQVAGIAESGEETLQKVEQLSPDLVLMDIRIKGELDGVQTAVKMQEKFDLPIIYLTSHSDPETVDRAKTTAPFGYLTKPLQQSNLQTSIEIALHKHRIDQEARQQRAWLNTVLQMMGGAVVVADAEQRIQFLNASAEQLTGWTAADACGRKLLGVLEIFDHELAPVSEELVSDWMLEDHVVSLPAGLTAMRKDGRAFILEGEVAPSVEGDERFGTVVTFRDATARRKQELVVRQGNKMEAVGRLASGVAHDFNTILAEIRCEAEHALQQVPADPSMQACWHKVLECTGAGDALTQQLIMFGYAWAV